MDKKRSGTKLNSRHTLIGQLLRFLVTLSGMALVLFASAGRLDWSAWMYLAVYSIGFAVNLRIMMPRDPELTAEQDRTRVEIHDWEKVITALLALLTFGALILAGLQVRMSWRPFLPFWVQVSGFVLLVAGKGITSWALAANPYFQTNVYFNGDGVQRLIGQGPYLYVRHPGYTGLALSALATPLLLGASWAMMLAGVTVAVFFVYAELEDRTLQASLGGYEQYVLRVKYRMLPGIW